MKNILTEITKAEEKGLLYFDKDGNLFTHEQLGKDSRKEYIQGLKDNTISMEKSYPEYFNEYMEDYLPTQAIYNVILATLPS